MEYPLLGITIFRAHNVPGEANYLGWMYTCRTFDLYPVHGVCGFSDVFSIVCLKMLNYCSLILWWDQMPSEVTQFFPQFWPKRAERVFQHILNCACPSHTNPLTRALQPESIRRSASTHWPPSCQVSWVAVPTLPHPTCSETCCGEKPGIALTLGEGGGHWNVYNMWSGRNL